MGIRREREGAGGNNQIAKHIVIFHGFGGGRKGEFKGQIVTETFFILKHNLVLQTNIWEHGRRSWGTCPNQLLDKGS